MKRSAFVSFVLSLVLMAGMLGTQLAYAAHLITSFNISPVQATPGTTITFTLVGTAGGTATATVGKVQIPLQEVSPGTYTGTYTLPSNLKQRVMVSGRLRLANGQQDKAKEMWIPSTGMTRMHMKMHHHHMGARENSMITILSPTGGTTVSQVFTVNGTTTPNTLVNIRVINTTGQVVTQTQTTSNANGNYNASIDLGTTIVSGSPLTVWVGAQGHGGTRIRLTRQ